MGQAFCFYTLSQRLRSLVYCWHGFNVWSPKSWPHPPPQVLGNFSCTFSTDCVCVKYTNAEFNHFFLLNFILLVGFNLQIWWNHYELCFCHLLLQLLHPNLCHLKISQTSPLSFCLYPIRAPHGNKSALSKIKIWSFYFSYTHNLNIATHHDK